MRNRFTVVLVFASSLSLLASACRMGGDPGGLSGDACPTGGWLCSTPACAQFPGTPGCRAVEPKNGYCPVDLYRCWDPTLSPDYCDHKTSMCVRARSPLPSGCNISGTVCSMSELATCFEIAVEDYFCKASNGYACKRYVCSGDGGAADMTPAADLTSSGGDAAPADLTSSGG